MNVNAPPEIRPPRHRGLRLVAAMLGAGILAFAGTPSAAFASTDYMYVNVANVIQNQVLSSSNSTIVGGAVQMKLNGEGWYAQQHGRTVASNGNIGGNYSMAGPKVNWTSPQAYAHADCFWTWPTYDGYKAWARCWVSKP